MILFAIGVLLWPYDLLPKAVALLLVLEGRRGFDASATPTPTP